MNRKIKPKPRIPTYDLVAVIRKSGKNPIRHEAWRFYSILDTLRWLGADLQTATDIAKWCGRSHEELTRTEGDITIELKEERGKSNDNS